MGIKEFMRFIAQKVIDYKSVQISNYTSVLWDIF